jgi:hypothetical protein
MQRHPRRSSVLEIDSDWARRLASLRAAAGVDASAELDVDHVRSVEGSIGARIPDPILALAAAGLPWLEQALGFSLARFAEHTSRARNARAPGDFVGIAAEGRLVHGFRPGRGDRRIDVYDADRREMTQRAIEAWLDALVASQLGRSVGAHAVEPLEVRLVRTVPTLGAGKRVRHRSWGEGRVLAEHGEGPTRKVKAEFPGLGLKVVQARFLEFIEE